MTRKANSVRNMPDLNGRFGEFGGRFVAETLMPLILNVEKSYFIPKSLRRFYRGESRDETIKKIDLVINNALERLEDNPNLKEFIVNASKGINNLKQTYTDCNQTKARLDTILVKIERLKDNTDSY